MSFTLSLLVFLTCLQPGWGQCNGTALVIQLELFTKVYIQSPGFQAGEYPQNLSCAWRFDRSRNASEIIYTLHLNGMKNTSDTISLYGGVDNTGTALINTTTMISQNYTQRKVVDHSSLFLLYTTDDVESTDGDGFEMYILESADYSGTNCSTTKQIQPQPITQYLTSPNFPQKYPINTTCAWNITTTYDVIVSVIYMDVETEPPTCYDYVTIGDSGRLCANWEFNINMTYVFNDSFLITFTSDNKQPEHGFVLSYVARYDNTTEAPTSMKPEVETTRNIELSTTIQPASDLCLGVIGGLVGVILILMVTVGILLYKRKKGLPDGKQNTHMIGMETTPSSANPITSEVYENVREDTHDERNRDPGTKRAEHVSTATYEMLGMKDPPNTYSNLSSRQDPKEAEYIDIQM